MANDIDLEQILDKALTWQEAGQLDLAEAGYRTVLQHDPNELDALNLLGVILQERGAIDESIRLIMRALEIDPAFPEALANLARAKRLVGEPMAAAEVARRAIALDPELTTAHLQLGRALFDLGDDAGAAEALRQATTLAPLSIEAFVPLGMALVRLNDPKGADSALTAALALAPDQAATTINLAPAFADLARIYRETGDASAAVEAGRRAVALDPGLSDAHLQLGRALLTHQDDGGAIEVFRRATAMAPGSLEAHIGLALALTRLQNHVAAVESWRAALALQPDDPGLLIEVASSLGALERFNEALATYRRADALVPGHPRAQVGIIGMLARIGDVTTAADLCRQAIEKTPDWSSLWVLMAYCEGRMGHFDAAADAYRRALVLEPGLGNALNGLAAVGERFDDDAARDAARDVVNDPSRPVRDRIAAGFALGRVHDRYGAYDEAFEAYTAANALMRADRGLAFDRTHYRLLVDRLIAAVAPQAFAATAGLGDPTEMPVFVVGMPRSGTTLVEQIAASHKLVFGAGEQKGIPRILAALGAEEAAWSPAAWDRASVRRETRSHARHLYDLAGGAVRVIDKQVDNIMFLGQIAVLFPRARIVVCRRDPRDVCLSCFFQFFSDDTMTWTNDLTDCGFRAREIDRLMDHWRKVLPIPILEIQYETLVGNLERESRRLIDFLGLEWDPACLAFHETERTVLTASYWQVRQPLYASSVGRWRHYQHHLGPLLRELGGSALPP